RRDGDGGIVVNSTGQPVLEVDDIQAFYGSIQALKGISLRVDEGEIVTLIGANGAGKSTTLRSINGLVRPRRGTIRFQGTAIGRALMARPKLLMLDEPSMGLAPIFVEKIFEIVVEINKEGTPILLVEQNALMALEVANRGYVLETGKIALTDDAKALRQNEQ